MPLGPAAVLPPTLLQQSVLQQRTQWIRDHLDLQVSRDGPETLDPNDVVELDELFKALQLYPITIEVVRQTRIHLALLQISGKATRWPRRLVDESDKVITTWEAHMGPLNQVRVPLYDRGGRLDGMRAIAHFGKEVSFFEERKHTVVASNRY
jgi:hypothetical protein